MICYNGKVLKNKRVDVIDVLNNTATNKNSSVFAWRLNLIAFVLAVLLGSLLGFFFGQYLLNWSKYAFQTNYQPGDTEVMQDLAKIMVLPNETPTISTVMDATNLQTQPFFNQVQQGDKIILFTNHQKVILYRPSSKQIVEVLPTTVNAESFSLP